MSNLSEKQKRWEMYMHKLNAVARSISQTYAKRIAEISVLPKSKIVVQAVRYRRNEDTMMSLKAQKLSAAYLKLWSDTYRDNELVHLVFEQKQLFALKRTKDSATRPIYIQAGDKEWRVVIESITAHPIHGWIGNAVFREYVVGKPNKMAIPLRYKMRRKIFENKTVIAPKINIQALQVVCYNEELPRMIEVEMDDAVKHNRLRLGEVIKFLPPGIELDRSKHPDLNKSIVKMTELEEDKLMDMTMLFDETKYRADTNLAITINERYSMKKDESGELAPGLPADFDMSDPILGVEPAPKKKSTHKPTRVKSIKEQIKNLGLEINPEMAQMDDKKKR